jgi:hypothetical protein
LTKKDDIDEYLRAIGIREVSDAEKIEYLVQRKFPGYNQPPPFPTPFDEIKHAKIELHKELIKEGNKFKDELKAMSQEELGQLFTQECAVAAKERELEEKNRFFNKSSAAADPSMKFWDLVTIEEAIALDFHKNPEIVNWESIRPYVSVSPFAKRYKQLRNLAIRAVAAGILSDPVTPKDFAIWREPIKYEISDVINDLLKEPEDGTSGSTSKTDHDTDNDTTKALPPRALTGIAKLFPIDRDEENNGMKWKKYAAEASRNGLIDARISKGGGSGESVFDPWRVGEWLVKKSHMSRDKVNRQLAKNLESGYEYMRDTLLS